MSVLQNRITLLKRSPKYSSALGTVSKEKEYMCWHISKINLQLKCTKTLYKNVLIL